MSSEKKLKSGISAKSNRWLLFLPIQMRNSFQNRPNLHKVLINTFWLFADRILRMGMGLLVGVWVARYLGPEQFGTMNYATAFVGLFSAIGSLGLNGIVVRDLVREPENANTILGTAFLLQLFGGLLAFILGIIAVTFVRPDDEIAQQMIAVLGFVTVFKASETIRYWFEAKIQSKYIVWIENGTFLIFAAIKVILILNVATLMDFVWINFAEGLVTAIGIFSIYVWSGGHLTAWRGHYSQAKKLLKDSWPLILSGIAVMVYMRIDQIMLGQMLDDKAVGVYSAAVRISEVWYFIPLAIISSVYPSIIEAKSANEALYLDRLQRLFNFMALISIIVAIFLTLFANIVVETLYGNEYKEANNVLVLLAWAGLFTSVGCASAKWVVIEGYFLNALIRVVAAAIINIIANLFLIPAYGIQGAAISTLLAYATANWLSLSISPKTRICFIMQTKAIFSLGGLLCRQGT